MNELSVFNFDNNKITAVIHDGKPAFVAMDVARALGYQRPADALTQHCKLLIKLKYGEMQCLGFEPKPEYMHEVAGEWYMDGRHVAEILGKEFKKTIRDLKTIVLMERDGEMVHHRDHSDLIDIFSVKGVICTKDDRGYVKDMLINEHYYADTAKELIKIIKA